MISIVEAVVEKGDVKVFVMSDRDESLTRRSWKEGSLEQRKDADVGRGG
jgi:hypothetical protein